MALADHFGALQIAADFAVEQVALGLMRLLLDLP
jgi:hypothetical protein